MVRTTRQLVVLLTFSFVAPIGAEARPRVVQFGSDADVFAARGNAWFQQKEYDKAIEEYNQAIRLTPNDYRLFINRGAAWLCKGEYDTAIQDYTESIRLAPNANAFLGRGSTWAYKKEYDKAIKDYDEAIRLYPQFAGAYRGRGLVRYVQKEYDKSIDDFTDALRLDPNDLMALTKRGTAWAHKKDYDKAIQDFNEVIRFNPQLVGAFHNRGQAWQRKKEYEKAINDYTEAIRLNPNLNQSVGQLAWLYATCPDARFRDGKKAVAYATKECELTKWKDAYALSTLAAASAESGDFDNAIKYEKLALEDKVAEKEYGDKWRKRIKLFEEKKPYHEP